MPIIIIMKDTLDRSPQSLSDGVTKACHRAFSRYHMKLCANKSLHCTDCEMVCDRSCFGCFTPAEAPEFEF